MRVVNRAWVVVILAAAFVSFAAAQQAPPGQAPTPEPGRPVVGGFPMGPSGKILEFRAEPSSIQPGQTSTLHWHAVNADDTYLDNCLGIVATLGSHEVSPKVTTTYTFTAKGRAGADTKSVTVTVAGTTPAPPRGCGRVRRSAQPASPTRRGRPSGPFRSLYRRFQPSARGQHFCEAGCGEVQSCSRPE